MTLRDAINLDLKRIRREQLVAVLLFFPSLAFLAYFKAESGNLVRIPAILFGIALALLAHAFWRIRTQIRCRACGRSIGQLLLKPELTGNIYAVLLCPVSLPEMVRQCPHCAAALDETQQFALWSPCTTKHASRH